MFWSIYWAGYIFSFLFMFIATIFALRKKLAEGTISESTVIEEYVGLILAAALWGFLSWVMVLIYLGLVIIGTGKIDPPTIARAR